MKSIILILILVSFAWGQEFDFTREFDVIPVSFDGVECQVPWTTGYDYINPTFCDIDGDDDQDLIFGSGWARLSYYRNIGSASNCSLEFVTDSLVELQGVAIQSQRPTCPAFCDIDNDNDDDLFVGCYYGYPLSQGRLFYFKNTGNYENPVFEFVEDLFQGIECPSNSTPFFVDIDADGDYDLFIGFSNPQTAPAGKMYFYRNTGTPDSAVMVLESSQFMGIDLGYYCIPAFCDIDNDGDYDMFLGDEDGMIHYYRNDGSPEEYDFIEVSSAYAGVDVVNIASPEFVDIDNDGDFDLFVGERSWGQDNRRGGINYYKNIGTPDSAVFELVTQNYLTIDIGLYPHPALVDINNDDLLDMFIGDSDGNINYFSNTGTEHNPCFTFETEIFEDVYGYYQSRPCFGDLDNDGDLDMYVGRTSWSTDGAKFFRNVGTSEVPDYVEEPRNYIEIDHDWASPALVDIDNDDDLDLFIGHLENQVIYYENTGNPFEMNFILITDNYFSTPLIWNEPFILCFGDIDSDGDYDMLRGQADAGAPYYVGSYLDFYRNIGDAYNPNFILEEEHFLDISLVKYAEPFLADIDNDGDLDLFVGDGNGGVSFWRNNEINSVNGGRLTVNRSFALLPNYPNPFNAVTAISFQLSAVSDVNLTVYDVIGREVATLINGGMDAGNHEVIWDAGGVSSGIYLIRLDTQAGYSKSRKVMLLK